MDSDNCSPRRDLESLLRWTRPRDRESHTGGPADQVGSRLHPGEIVLEIDGTKVDRKTDLTTLLNGPLERQIRLTVQPLSPKKTDEVEAAPGKEGNKNREV